jgi:hypothetical protein
MNAKFSFYGVFESKMLMKLCRFDRDKVTEDWRNLRNKELHNLYLLNDEG